MEGLHGTRVDDRPRAALLVLLAAAFCGSLHWSYATIVGGLFDYRGFVYQHPTFLRGAACYLFAAAPAAWLSFRDSRPSHLVVTLFYLMAYVPACLVPGLTASFEPGLVLRIQATVLAAFGVVLFFYQIPLPQRAASVAREKLFFPIFGTFAAICVGTCLIEFGFSLQLHSLDDVYDVRTDFTDGLTNVGLLGRYTFGWLANIVGPVLLMFGWRQKRTGVILLGALVELWLFSLTGRKSFLFSIGLVFAVIGAIRRNATAPTVPVMIAGATGLVVLCGAIDLQSGGESYWLTSLLVRRMFLTPGLLTGYYFDFFTRNELALYGHGILSWLVTPRYSEPTGILIGREYFGIDATNNSCANIWADGFANLGFGGVFLASLGLAVFLRAYDTATRRVDLRLAIAPLVLPCIALSNGSLLTSLFTHGMLLGLILARHFPTERQSPTPGVARRFVPRPHVRTTAAVARRAPRAIRAGRRTNPP